MLFLLFLFLLPFILRISRLDAVQTKKGKLNAEKLKTRKTANISLKQWIGKGGLGRLFHYLTKGRREGGRGVLYHAIIILENPQDSLQKIIIIKLKLKKNIQPPNGFKASPKRTKPKESQIENTWRQYFQPDLKEPRKSCNESPKTRIKNRTEKKNPLFFFKNRQRILRICKASAGAVGDVKASSKMQRTITRIPKSQNWTETKDERRVLMKEESIDLQFLFRPFFFSLCFFFSFF